MKLRSSAAAPFSSIDARYPLSNIGVILRTGNFDCSLKPPALAAERRRAAFREPAALCISASKGHINSRFYHACEATQP